MQLFESLESRQLRAKSIYVLQQKIDLVFMENIVSLRRNNRSTMDLDGHTYPSRPQKKNPCNTWPVEVVSYDLSQVWRSQLASDLG